MPQNVPRTSGTLFALQDDFGEWILHLGNPFSELKPLTYRGYHMRYFGSLESFYEEFPDEEDRPSLSDEAPEHQVIESWCRTDSSNAMAFRLLEEFDIGPHRKSRNAIGQLNFIDGACPGNDYLAVHAEEPLSLSLLQDRLNQLNSGVRVRLWES